MIADYKETGCPHMDSLLNDFRVKDQPCISAAVQARCNISMRMAMDI